MTTPAHATSTRSTRHAIGGIGHIDATSDADIVVLDAHGVVFDRAFPRFVERVARARGDDSAEIWARWTDHARLPFWEGRTTPAQMWASLFPGVSPARLSAELERSYSTGPLFRFAAESDKRLWLLSNHRSGWLLPRLTRFGLDGRFERVLVSDRLGAAKPDPRAFAPVIEAADQSRVTVLDDSPANVEAARSLGLEAQLVRHDGSVTNRRPVTAGGAR